MPEVSWTLQEFHNTPPIKDVLYYTNFNYLLVSKRSIITTTITISNISSPEGQGSSQRFVLPAFYWSTHPYYPPAFDKQNCTEYQSPCHPTSGGNRHW